MHLNKVLFLVRNDEYWFVLVAIVERVGSVEICHLAAALTFVCHLSGLMTLVENGDSCQLCQQLLVLDTVFCDGSVRN